MAIFHLSAKIISRRAGRSSTAAAAYRAGVSLKDERTGEVHDYQKKQGVEYSEIIVPEGMWQLDRSTLWNAVEVKNKRADAQVAREMSVALPSEITPIQRQDLVKSFAQMLADKYSVGVDLAIHYPSKNGDKRNFHAHLLLTTNRIESINGKLQLGNKVRELDMIASAKHDKTKTNEIESIRAEWATRCNIALERAGHKERVSHKSLEAQGIDREPTSHLGPTATAMERRGEMTERGDLNRWAGENRVALQELAAAEKTQTGAERIRAQARQWRLAKEQARQQAIAAEKARQQERERHEREEKERQAKLEAERRAERNRSRGLGR